MAITPTSIYGIFEANRSLKAIRVFDLIQPLLDSSYWQQRCRERGFHGVFYHILRQEASWSVYMLPFWSSMSDLERMDVESYLAKVHLERGEVLILPFFGPIMRDPLNPSPDREKAVFVFTAENMATLTSDDWVIQTYKDLPEGYQLIGQRLGNFFAHFHPSAYECV